jgi:hypothetical protein
VWEPTTSWAEAVFSEWGSNDLRKECFITKKLPSEFLNRFYYHSVEET